MCTAAEGLSSPVELILTPCATPDTALRGVVAALCLAEAPYQIFYSTPGWRALFGQRSTLRCLENGEHTADVQLAGLLAQLRHGLAVRAPLCSCDRHGKTFKHLASAAPIFSAAGDVTFLRVAVEKVGSVGSGLRQVSELEPATWLRTISLPPNLVIPTEDGSPYGSEAASPFFPPTPNSQPVSEYGELGQSTASSPTSLSSSVLSETATELWRAKEPAPFEAAGRSSTRNAPFLLPPPTVGALANKPAPSQPPASRWLGTLEAFASLGGLGANGRAGRGFGLTRPGRASRAEDSATGGSIVELPGCKPGRPHLANVTVPCALEPPPAPPLPSLPAFVPPPEDYEGGYVVITGATAPYVVHWASPGWLRLCGFRPSGLDVLGRSLAAIQGERTAPAATAKMMACVRKRRGTSSRSPINFVNYDTEGVPFSHSVSLEYLPAKYGRDGRCGAAFRASSTDVKLHPDGAARWVDETQNKTREATGDFWSDDVEEFWSTWAERAGAELPDTAKAQRDART